jgi:glycosyltransferase involved in cell wall biosynthesis
MDTEEPVSLYKTSLSQVVKMDIEGAESQALQEMNRLAAFSDRFRELAMRVLCVAGYYKPAYVYGGPVRSVPDLCEAMAQIGARVTVFTTNANGPGQVLDTPTDRAVDVNGVQVHYFPVSWPLARLIPFYSPALGRACSRHVDQFDTVYLPGSWTHSTYAGARTALRVRIPYVISPRGSFMDWSMSQKTLKKRLYLALIERRLINGAAAIHVTCALERQQQEKWRFKPPAVVIPNGINVARFEELPCQEKWRQLLGIPPTGTLSLFVGRLHREKRLDLLVDAFATLTRQMPDAHLLIVGPDQDGSGHVARQQAKDLGLSDRVHFAGLLAGSQVRQAYAEADVLVLLSHRENFGMVVLEAMAAGLPALVTREVGLATEIEQADAGLVVAAEPEDVGAAWQKLLADPGLRTAMGERGRTLVRERFASSIVAIRMLDLFASVLT